MGTTDKILATFNKTIRKLDAEADAQHARAQAAAEAQEQARRVEEEAKAESLRARGIAQKLSDLIS